MITLPGSGDVSLVTDLSNNPPRDTVDGVDLAFGSAE
jgi:hypothetical protein